MNAKENWWGRAVVLHLEEKSEVHLLTITALISLAQREGVEEEAILAQTPKETKCYSLPPSRAI